MGIRLGNWDPLQLIFNVMNALMRNGHLSYDDAKMILRGALPPEMDPAEKERILDSLVRRSPNPPTTP